jgi:hypothetical protein
MLQINNTTPFTAAIMPLVDADGIDTVFTVVKATFRLGPILALAEEQLPITRVDQYYGKPDATSIRAASDVSLEKPGTDIVLVGNAWAPGGQPTWRMDVQLAVGPVQRTVSVFGDRVWDMSRGVATAAWVAPFLTMPLTWERAFGGADETNEGPIVDARNPVGVGFHASGGRRALEGLPLPNVEDPASLISSLSDTPSPAGLAPVAPSWLSRRRYAGSYDAVWQKERAPFLPTDFDHRFCQIAPQGLFTTTPLLGGEAVDVRGATPGGHLACVLPNIRVAAQYELTDRLEKRLARLDTVVIAPDAGILTLVWRAALPCDKKTLTVREVTVDATAPNAAHVA